MINIGFDFIIYIIIMDYFDTYSVEMDAEVLHQDLDDIDLYATKVEETESESDVLFE